MVPELPPEHPESASPPVDPAPEPALPFASGPIAEDPIPTVMPVEEPPIPQVAVAPQPRTVQPMIVAPPPRHEPVYIPEVLPTRSIHEEHPAPRASRRERFFRYPSLVRTRMVSILPLLVSMAVFAAMMTTSFGHGLYSLFSESSLETLSESEIRTRLINEMMVVEGLDSLLVLIGILVAGLPFVQTQGNRLITWALAAPGFICLLAINIGYHQFLKWFVSLAADTHDEVPDIDIGLADGWWAILLVCIQPAVVEELFFRYLLYGHLRPHLGLHGAVWVSSVIFGMAHLGNIPGWPVLILLGAGLGYSRAFSRGLILPILLHFLHNLAVLLIDYVELL